MAATTKRISEYLRVDNARIIITVSNHAVPHLVVSTSQISIGRFSIVGSIMISVELSFAVAVILEVDVVRFCHAGASVFRRHGTCVRVFGSAKIAVLLCCWMDVCGCPMAKPIIAYVL